MPTGDARDQLKLSIKLLKEIYDGAFFEPHVTLLSSFLGEEKILIEKTKKISKNISPFMITLNGFSYSKEFFESLFLKVQLDQHLRLVRKACCEEFRIIEHNYFPHLSLIYGDFSVAKKKKMMSRIGVFPKYFFVNKIFLVHNDEIQLRWKIIKEFPLK